MESPGAVELIERPLAQIHLDLDILDLEIFGRERLADTAVIDVNGRQRPDRVAHRCLGTSAPGQEFRIALAVIHQPVHLCGRIRNEGGFFDVGHENQILSDRARRRPWDKLAG